MKPIFWLLFPVLIGSAAGYHYGTDNQYVTLFNHEKLYNGKMYNSSPEELASLGRNSKAFVTDMGNYRPQTVKVTSEAYDRWNTTVRLADYSLKIQTPCSSGTG